ncbi:acireductone synthase [Leptospira ilyithenensis]|uniref:Acireductone synthase n=1 Tax=Leptospira ilyithenensis TaxID=2484901 RepID=A0A4R9LU83_9LEPT|nr:acireductone synthase [Leptospira ilyithenensis]TGN14272.1 acireductone synthase [Leptospira ilyithenensis]
MKHFLLDIEGTTAPISFVHEVLFPFAKEKLDEFLTGFVWSRDQLELVRSEFEKDKLANDPDFVSHLGKGAVFSEKIIPTYFRYLILKDRKFGPLKEIQGKIWKSGYESDAIKSIIFPDVADFLKKAKEKGIACHVYSSGSVEAQILIYKYSDIGDLREYFQSYFDTAIGGKRESSSYQNIAEKLGADIGDIVFFTDTVEEAIAAKSAGMSVFILNRPGNLPQIKHEFPVLKELGLFQV